MRNKPTRPEDFLPGNQSVVEYPGVTVRKGTMGAVLINIEVIESNDACESEKQQAIKIIKELAPSLKGMGLTKHIIWRNPIIQAIFNKTM